MKMHQWFYEELLELLRSGKSQRDIAKMLKVSQPAVSSYTIAGTGRVNPKIDVCTRSNHPVHRGLDAAGDGFYCVGADGEIQRPCAGRELCCLQDRQAIWQGNVHAWVCPIRDAEAGILY